jgi:hypothetical protein
MIHPVVVSEHRLTEKWNAISRPEGRNSWPVDNYRIHEHGFYWALPLPDGPEAKVKYIRAHVLPELGLQGCRFEWWRGHPYGGYDYYLDLLVWEGERVVIHDTDEFLAALETNLMTPREAEHALMTAHETLNALSERGDSLSAYLESRGIVLTWT